ncbi:TPR-like protein [Acephala macrosclerotiorum]|nr:TPR-like protein [Acephala macrosclerotiorum]
MMNAAILEIPQGRSLIEARGHDPLQRSKIGDIKTSERLSDNIKLIYKDRFIRLPFQQNNSFVGRQDIIQSLDEVLSGEIQDRRLALYGLGGIGKSQIANQWAHEKARTNRDLSIFWVFAGNRERFERDYLDLAKLLDLKGRDDPVTDVLLLVKNSIENLSIPWLMIIDNADDMVTFYGSAITGDDEICSAREMQKKGTRPFSEYIPSTTFGTIIYTTRTKINALRLTDEGKILHVAEMRKEDALRLFRLKIAGEIVQEEQWDELLRELEFLPLAIVQAASYIRQNSWTVQKYLDHFRERGSQAAISVLSHNFRDKHRELAITNAVLQTWVVTVEQLESLYPTAATVLWKAAFLFRQNIPRYLLEGETRRSSRCSDISKSQYGQNGLSSFEFDRAIGTLEAYSFLVVSSTGASTAEETYTVHGLVQLFSRYWLEHRRRCAGQQLAETALKLESEFPYSETTRTWTKCADLMPHIEILMDHQSLFLTRYTVRYCSIFYIAGLYLQQRGKYLVAEKYARRGLVLATEERNMSETGGGDLLPELTHDLQALLGAILMKNGRLTEAEMLLRESLQGTQAVEKGETPIVFVRMAKLGRVLSELKRFTEADDLLQRALHRLRFLSKYDTSTLECARNLGNSFLNQNRFDAAEFIMRRVVRQSRKVFGLEDRRTLSALQSLSCILRMVDKYEEAERNDRVAVECLENLLGPEHPETAFGIAHLAISLDTMSQHPAAEKLHRRCLGILERNLGPHHLQTLSVVRNLALCLKQQGRSDEVKGFMQRAHDGFRALYSDANSEVRELKIECEKLLLTSALYDDSKAKLAVLEESDACSERELLLAVKQLGSVLADQTRFPEALIHLERAYRGLEKYGPTDEETMDCFWWLSNTYLNLRSYSKEVGLCQDTLTKLESKLGPDHTETLKVVRELSRCLAYQGCDEEAVKCMQRVVAGYEKIKGPADEMTRRYSDELSTLWDRLYRVVCDYCFRSVANHNCYYHCNICFSGNFDLCEDCVDNGISCAGNASHIMIKRFLQKEEK